MEDQSGYKIQNWKLLLCLIVCKGMERYDTMQWKENKNSNESWKSLASKVGSKNTFREEVRGKLEQCNAEN